MRYSNRSARRDTAMHLALTLAVIAGFLSGAAVGDEIDNEAVSFSRDIAPLLTRRCAVCHITGEEPGLVVLVPGSAHGSLVGVPSQQSPLLRVQPGAPDESYLYRKLAGSHVEAGGTGARMPFATPTLPDSQLKLFERWIKEGALNN